jgi:hypothetical protein
MQSSAVRWPSSRDATRNMAPVLPVASCPIHPSLPGLPLWVGKILQSRKGKQCQPERASFG